MFARLATSSIVILIGKHIVQKRLSSALIAVSKRHVESNNNLIAVYKVVVNVCHKTVINKRD